jgi:hypothetical protein
MVKKNDKKDLAEALYMSGINQQDIAEKIGMSRVTINKWCMSGGWKERRGAKTITRQELINKILLSINDALTECTNDPKKFGATSDQLAKLASTIDKLDKKGNVVDYINTFVDFSDWLESQVGINKEVTPVLIRVITTLQNNFINQRF